MKKLPRFSGRHRLVSALNRLVEAIEERTPLKGDECPIDYFPNGFRPKPKGKGGAAESGVSIWNP